MSRTERLQKNSRLLFWSRALTELKILNSIIVLFYLQRGVQLDEIFYLSIVWSATSLILEIPTGYLADRFGRKRTLLLGVILSLLSWVFAWFANGFADFSGVMVLAAAAFSCFSGTEEALLYDSLKELGEERQMTAYNGRQHAARHIFKIFIPALGAWIARGLLESQFQILIGVEIIVAAVSLFVLSRIIEPMHHERVLERERNIFHESLAVMTREPFIVRAALNKVIFFIAGFITWRAYQPFLAEHGISVVWLGVFYIFLHTLMFASTWFAGNIEKRLGTIKIIDGTVILFIAALVGVLITDTPWILFMLLIFAITLDSARGPVFAHLVNSRIGSESRATTLSNLNVLKSVLDMPILFLSGWLAVQQIELVFVVAIGLSAAVLLFFRISSHELVPRST